MEWQIYRMSFRLGTILPQAGGAMTRLAPSEAFLEAPRLTHAACPLLGSILRNSGRAVFLLGR